MSEFIYERRGKGFIEVTIIYGRTKPKTAKALIKIKNILHVVDSTYDIGGILARSEIILDYRQDAPLPVLESYEEITNRIFFEALKKEEGETE